MSQAPKTSSPSQAANFHAQPASAAAREEAKKPANANVGAARVLDRDAEAGSVTGEGSSNTEVNQPLRQPARDRSQVS